MKKKIAIVSSYSEECGAAYYSSRLLKHLSAAGYEVDIKRLPVSLLRALHPYHLRQKGDQEIRRISNEIRDYDAVLFQFEPGLYGSIPKLSYPRVLKLLKASKCAVLTVHGFDREMSKRSISGVVRSVTRGRLLDTISEVFEGGIDPVIGSFWQYVSRSKHVSVMTFNRADLALLQRYFDLERIVHYPITYFEQSEVDEIRASTDRERLLLQYGLDPSKKYFSVYGFLSYYKGHLTALKALEYLPEDWHLAIVGGEHPQALQAEMDIGPYIRQIMAFSLMKEPRQGIGSALITGDDGGEQFSLPAVLNQREIRKNLFEKSEFKHFFPTQEIRNRVHFVGQVSDDEMPKFYSALDYAVHPYIKTKSGQSGSGPATFALEFRSRALFSNAPVFREMGLYYKDAMRFFNIGNFLELAESLQRFESVEAELKNNLNVALQAYNPKGMVDTYRQLMGA